MVSISYQLYSSRNAPLTETLDMLAALGIREVEGFGPLFEDPAATRAELDARGLAMPTAHVALDLLEKDPKRALAIAETLGIESIIVPYLMPDARPIDRAGWAAFGQRLAEAGKPVRAAGLGFGWHNHDFEFIPTADGALPIELIAGVSDEIGLELDLAWILVAGQDPVDWIQRYAGRIIAAHVKDRAPQGEAVDEGGWADIGYGVMDWPRVVAALDAAGVTRWVMEHDNPADHRRFATRSYAALSSFRGAS